MKRMIDIQPFEPELTLYSVAMEGTTNDPLTPVNASKIYNNSFIIGDKIYIDYRIDFSSSAYSVDAFRKKILGIKIPGRFYDPKSIPSKECLLTISAINRDSYIKSDFDCISKVEIHEYLSTKNTDFFKNPYIGLYIRFGSATSSNAYYIYHITGWIDADQWVADPKWAKTTVYNSAGLGPLINTTTGASYDNDYDNTEWRIEDLKGTWILNDIDGIVDSPSDYGLSVKFQYSDGTVEYYTSTWNNELKQYKLEITEDMYYGPNGSKPFGISLETY